MSRVLLLLVVLVLLAGCYPAVTPTPVESQRSVLARPTTVPRLAVTPQPGGLPPPTWNANARRCPSLLTGPVSQLNLWSSKEVNSFTPSDGAGNGAEVYFVDGQVLVTGQQQDVEAAVTASGLNLERGPSLGSLQLDNVTWDTWLYQFTPGEKFHAYDVVEALRNASVSLEHPVLILADLNLLAARTVPRESCEAGANPLAGEDSPLAGEDSPLAGEDSPFNIPGMPASAAFWDQWALGAIRAGGVSVGRSGAHDDNRPGGKGAQIVILDTSPFTQPGRGQAVFSGKGWIQPTLEVCVDNRLLSPAGLTDRCRELWDQSDHGIFVAGLAHAAAPKSTLHLIRVLNKNGQGDLATTLYALSHLDPRQIDPSQHGMNTVINMSLGFVPVPGKAHPRWKEFCETLKFEKPCSDILDLAHVDLTRFQIDDRRKMLTDLQDMLEGATLEAYVADVLRKGVVLVAAAGNKAKMRQPVPAPEMPASFAAYYPTVLAAAASTFDRERAFYSNAGVIAAPGGGDNRLGCATAPAVCERDASQCCWDEPKYWMISVATFPGVLPGRIKWDYGAWVGTSFATPLVSGMVANAFETMTGPVTPPASKVVDETKRHVCPPPPVAPSEFPAGIAGYCP